MDYYFIMTLTPAKLRVFKSAVRVLLSAGFDMDKAAHMVAESMSARHLSERQHNHTLAQARRA